MGRPELNITFQSNGKLHARVPADDPTIDVPDTSVDVPDTSVFDDFLSGRTFEMFEDWLRDDMFYRRSDLELLGSYLYRALFKDEYGKIESAYRRNLRETIRKGESLHVTLSFADNYHRLASKPWEFLYDPDPEVEEFFVLRRSMAFSRLITTEANYDAAKPDEGPLRILVVASQREDSETDPAVKLKKDLEDLKTPLEPELKPQCECVSNLTRYNYDNLITKNESFKPHVLHVIAHRRYESDGETFAWWPDREFARFVVGLKPNPRFVFFHLYAGAKTGKDNPYSNFADLAAELFPSNIQAVVGMQLPVESEYAAKFSTALYTALYKEVLSSVTIAGAVQTARRKIADEHDEVVHKGVFGIPVLYTDKHATDLLYKKEVNDPYTGQATQEPKIQEEFHSWLQSTIHEAMKKDIEEEIRKVGQSEDELERRLEKYRRLLKLTESQGQQGLSQAGWGAGSPASRGREVSSPLADAFFGGGGRASIGG